MDSFVYTHTHIYTYVCSHTSAWYTDACADGLWELGIRSHKVSKQNDLVMPTVIHGFVCILTHSHIYICMLPHECVGYGRVCRRPVGARHMVAKGVEAE